MSSTGLVLEVVSDRLLSQRPLSHRPRLPRGAASKLVVGWYGQSGDPRARNCTVAFDSRKLLRVCSKRKNSESRDALLMVHCCWMVEGVMKTKVGYKMPAQPPCLPNRDFEPQHSSTMHKADVLSHDFIMRSLAGYNANDVPTRQSL